MSKITIRYNFETNSSSMHSLAIRRESGQYTDDELNHSEAIANTHSYDAILTLKDGHIVTTEEIHNDGWIWDNSMRVWSSDIELRHSAMKVMSSFRDKFVYALATVYGHRRRNWEKRIEEIKAVFAKYLPDVALNMERIRLDRFWGYGIGTTQYLLYPFLKKNKITIEEFLTNTKYIVIVDYSEYQKMQWLNMVDETQIVDVYCEHELDDHLMNIEDGVWKLRECDLNFGRAPFRVLGTPEGKARYALASYHSANIEQVLEILQEIYPDLQKIELPPDEYSNDGLEHGWCDDSVLPTEIPLRDFILDKKYVVIADGDEYCVWSDFYHTALFNKEAYPNVNTCDE